eukprot:EC786072.1.p1 GENE.EC786072.1~~EC786072.1.p1  ORF type:complete len:125 (+),score=16.38 EC786072.1:33-407(+)
MPRCCKCWNDCAHWCRTCDPDDVFSYSTLKLVNIRDHRLGCVHYVALVFIFIYVVVYNGVVKRGYLAVETPDGGIELNISRPSDPPLPPTEYPYWSASPDPYIPGIQKYPWIYWGKTDIVRPPT